MTGRYCIRVIKHIVSHIIFTLYARNVRLALEADISSIQCKDDVTYYTFDDFRGNSCQSCL